jgi:hypothetical protein
VGTQQIEQHEKRMRDLESRVPVVEFEIAGKEPDRQIQRTQKNGFYDKRGLSIKDMSPDAGEEMAITEWALHVPALPTIEAESIVVGEVFTSKAYLSNDKSGVYSEFQIRVEEILNARTAGIGIGSLITADRLGGFVLYPNGHKRLFSVGGQNMPRVGVRHVLFLTTSSSDHNYHILTGYELKDGKVIPLDDSKPMKAYEGSDEASFLTAVKDTIARAKGIKGKPVRTNHAN